MVLQQPSPRISKRPYQLVLAYRCMLCNLPKHLHERNKDGDIRVRYDLPLPKPRIDYPDVCQPNPVAARRMGLFSSKVFGRRVA